jgi:hypothetical protein
VIHHCRGAGFTIERFDRWHHAQGDRCPRTEPVLRCSGCGRTGYRETFDPVAAALDARLGLPLRPVGAVAKPPPMRREEGTLQAARQVRREAMA